MSHCNLKVLKSRNGTIVIFFCAKSIADCIVVMVQMISNQIDKMREAADQLVKVALDEATITKPIISLREGLDSGFKSQNNVLVSIMEEVANMKSIVQSFETLKSGVGDLKAQLILLSKQRSVEWALSNCSLNSFDYYTKDGQTCKSSEIARLCLLAFRIEFGRYINDGFMDRYNKNDETQKQFREKLQEQLHELLGKKPRIAKAEHGWCVYYD